MLHINVIKVKSLLLISPIIYEICVHNSIIIERSHCIKTLSGLKIIRNPMSNFLIKYFKVIFIKVVFIICRIKKILMSKIKTKILNFISDLIES